MRTLPDPTDDQTLTLIKTGQGALGAEIGLVIGLQRSDEIGGVIDRFSQSVGEHGAVVVAEALAQRQGKPVINRAATCFDHAHLNETRVQSRKGKLVGTHLSEVDIARPDQVHSPIQ